ITEESRRQKVIAALHKLAADAGAGEATLVALIGTPGLEITDYARRQQADLIVIPSHGYHGVKRLFLGSVAERVIRHASLWRAAITFCRRDSSVISPTRKPGDIVSSGGMT
ncbi:MAG: universal stress protein, partial [Planctomycetia bacterium]|nr:universal stress protein [Planctomycetia bacterium]